jgi:hypothetical protein
MEMLERVRNRSDDEEFDLLHVHLDYYPFSLRERQEGAPQQRLACTAPL